MIIFLIIGLLLGAAVVVFAIQNVTPVTVIFMSWHFEGSLAIILVLAVLVGVLLCALLFLPDVIRKRLHISRLKRHNDTLEDELVNKKIEVETEKSKLAANNAYLDDLERMPKV